VKEEFKKFFLLWVGVEEGSGTSADFPGKSKIPIKSREFS
jgi:hypothetical protein